MWLVPVHVCTTTSRSQPLTGERKLCSVSQCVCGEWSLNVHGKMEQAKSGRERGSGSPSCVAGKEGVVLHRACDCACSCQLCVSVCKVNGASH